MGGNFPMFFDTGENYTVNLNRGSYLLELWGAQGGNISDTLQGGKGGYSKGILKLSKTTKVHIFLGGTCSTSDASCRSKNTFNGGGKGMYTNNVYLAAPGGGSTDIRLDFSLESRIIVAGGGSGAAKFDTLENSGACGGGDAGEDGTNGYIPGSGTSTLSGKGGNQTSPGFGVDKRRGAFGEGGNQTTNNNYGSGGGSGYFGGGAGHFYGATGGGGSGYFSPLLHNAKTYSGCTKYGNLGMGKAKINLINYYLLTRSVCYSKAHSVLIYIMIAST